MSKVLYIKANAKPEGKSRTFKVSDNFVEKYKKAHPEDEITTLNLYKENIDFLPMGELDLILRPDMGRDRNHPILKYTYQFLEADKIIIAAPFWNLGFPAILKAYLDYITINGITFKYTEEGPVGLCSGKKAIHFVARGGNYSTEPYSSFEMGDRYLRTLLGFMGIQDFTTIAAEGLDVVGNDENAIVNDAIQRAEALVDKF
ncbi:FMN-dependent NADH-azoreductase [Anaeropeptidivorans aminofermentans]|uniref:FMN-dependent NADH-azoreductase n=1 Tax=Anaeropeptidivorans aminofermentans TaxID=2934315 RepID=UPI002024D3B1|nr:FMN-dependent NADH-azoreductase [Anaeropeptidivorans aminofermentans]